MALSLGAAASAGLVPLQEGALAVFGLLFMLVPIVFAVLILAGMWKTFEKAGEPGWRGIIPIYNFYVLTVDIADRGILWFVLGFLFWIPYIVPLIDVAERFGKGAGYAVGLLILPFVFFPLLGFGGARFQGGSGGAAAV